MQRSSGLQQFWRQRWVILSWVDRVFICIAILVDPLARGIKKCTVPKWKVMTENYFIQVIQASLRKQMTQYYSRAMGAFSVHTTNFALFLYSSSSRLHQKQLRLDSSSLFAVNQPKRWAGSGRNLVLAHDSSYSVHMEMNMEISTSATPPTHNRLIQCCHFLCVIWISSFITHSLITRWPGWFTSWFTDVKIAVVKTASWMCDFWSAWAQTC